MRRLRWLGLVAVWLVGCGPDAGGAGSSSSSSSSGGAVTCTSATAGSQKLLPLGGTVTLMALQPMPAEKGDNTWTLTVADAAGAVVTDAQVTLRPFMPAHGHGTNPAEFQASHTGGGNYQVGPFNLFMPGTWQLRVDVVRNGNPDEVAFTVCVAG